MAAKKLINAPLTEYKTLESFRYLYFLLFKAEMMMSRKNKCQVKGFRAGKWKITSSQTQSDEERKKKQEGSTAPWPMLSVLSISNMCTFRKHKINGNFCYFRCVSTVLILRNKGTQTNKKKNYP